MLQGLMPLQLIDNEYTVLTKHGLVWVVDTMLFRTEQLSSLSLSLSGGSLGTLSPNGSMNESIGLEIALHNLLSASMDALPQATKSDIAPASVSHTVASCTHCQL